MIINLTQHPATAEQAAAGVVDLSGDALNALRDALTFHALPTREEIRSRAEYIAALAAYAGDDAGPPTAAMIGGAAYLMSALEGALDDLFITPVYAFSLRESVEHVEDDGAVVKKNIFRHVGFVVP